MLRIAVQAKGRLFDETMSFLEESDIKLSATKRSGYGSGRFGYRRRKRVHGKG